MKMTLPTNFHKLPKHIRRDILDKIINPLIFLPQYFIFHGTPSVGYYEDVQPSWSSYVVLPYIVRDEYEDYNDD